MTYPTCILCDSQGPQVRMGLVEWADPQLWGKRFQALTVCTDRRECRQRVEQRGEPWPLAERGLHARGIHLWESSGGRAEVDRVTHRPMAPEDA